MSSSSTQSKEDFLIDVFSRIKIEDLPISIFNTNAMSPSILRSQSPAIILSTVKINKKFIIMTGKVKCKCQKELNLIADQIFKIENLKIKVSSIKVTKESCVFGEFKVKLNY
jgi:hypothetical protein